MSTSKGSVMKSKLAIAISAIIYSQAAWSIEPTSIPTESGFDLTPTMNTGLKHDDNVTSASSNEISSWVLTINPTMQAIADDGVNSYAFTASLIDGTYTQSSDDDFTDTFLGSLIDLQTSETGKVQFKADLIWGHEDRGTGVTEGLENDADEPTEFKSQTASGYYEYGVKAAPARIKVGGRYFNKEYTNQREVTQFRDYDSTLGGVTFYYDTGSGVSAVAESTYDIIKYDFTDLDSSRDSDDMYVKAGAEWNVTAITSGEIKLGYQKKDFDDASREDFDGLAWNASVTWLPLTYSSFTLGTGRKAKDPIQGGDYIQETTYNASWQHQWNAMLSTSLAYTNMDEEYVGVERNDDVESVTLSGKYALARWIDITVFGVVTDKTSSVAGIEFDRQIVGISLDMSM